MIDKLADWLQRTFAFLSGNRKLALTLAILLLAAIIVSPIPPFP